MGRRYHTRRSGSYALACALAVSLAGACDGGETGSSQFETPPVDFAWPEGPRHIAVLTTRDHGEIHIALYPELAPASVAQFERLVSEGFYDGLTFHRVIPGFMIQGGDPLSRDDDPHNDGRGGPPGAPLPDEFGRAPFVRGAVAMANSGRPHSGGSQFFIVNRETRHLDGQYSLFGRVDQGLETVDAIAEVETDIGGRFGPAHRPIEPVVIEQILIAPAKAGRSTR